MNAKETNEVEMLSIAEVARQLHVSRQRAYELAARGRIPATRMGRRVIVPRAAWDQWCAHQAEVALARCGGEVGGDTRSGGSVVCATEDVGHELVTENAEGEGCDDSAC